MKADPDNRAADQLPVLIPYTALSAAALHGVIEAFVLREGTDYGEHECTQEQKIAQVMRQIVRGEAIIIFDPQTESVDVVLADRAL